MDKLLSEPQSRFSNKLVWPLDPRHFDTLAYRRRPAAASRYQIDPNTKLSVSGDLVICWLETQLRMIGLSTAECDAELQ